MLLKLGHTINLLHALSVYQIIDPSRENRILRCVIPIRDKGCKSSLVPRDEGQVGVRDLVSDQVFIPRAFEMGINHKGDSLDLILIPVNGRGDVLLRMDMDEPGSLSKIRALATHLKMEPSLCNPFFLRSGILEFVVFVICLDQILDNRSGLQQLDSREKVKTENEAHLPKGDVGVWILYRWETAVWVEKSVWLFFDLIIWSDFDREGKT
jgi:hypothetical protein